MNHVPDFAGKLRDAKLTELPFLSSIERAPPPQQGRAQELDASHLRDSRRVNLADSVRGKHPQLRRKNFPPNVTGPASNIAITERLGNGRCLDRLEAEG